MKLRFLTTAIVASTMAASVLSATPAAVAPPAAPKARTSPHETINVKLDDNRVTVVYGRPYSKDPKTGAPRKIWGALVPTGKVWRLGADEATLFLTAKPIKLGGVDVPGGGYSAYLLLAADGSAKLLLNRRLGQWGAEPYDASQEFAQIDLKSEPLSAPVDQFTMALEREASGDGVLKLAWETTQFSVPIKAAKK